MPSVLTQASSVRSRPIRRRSAPSADNQVLDESRRDFIRALPDGDELIAQLDTALQDPAIQMLVDNAQAQCTHSSFVVRDTGRMLRESEQECDHLAELNAARRAQGFEQGMHFVMNYDERVAAQGAESAYAHAKRLYLQREPRDQHPMDRLIGLEIGMGIQVPRTPSPMHAQDEIPDTPPLPRHGDQMLDVVSRTPSPIHAQDRIPATPPLPHNGPFDIFGGLRDIPR